MWCHAGCTGRETIDDCGMDFVCPKCKKGGKGDDIILENVREDEEEKNKKKDESKKRERRKQR